MRQVLGMAFIAASMWLLVYGFVWFSNFVVQPESFPLYQQLAELPEAERTITSDAGDMVMPVGLFKVSGFMFVIFLLFIVVGVIKMFFGAGVTLLAPKVEDALDKLIKKLKSEETNNYLNSQSKT